MMQMFSALSIFFSPKEVQTFTSLSPSRHRRPGRPTKAQSLNSKRLVSHSARKQHRALHNESGARSRGRLNKALEEFWKNESMAVGRDDNRETCRAEKVEIATSYIKN